ncbi:MAG: sulfatase-like hydrolase/transferase, partial [Acidimicrobiales bacterium]|nr:sulfatase-like hydrolase/transferase [Acidimicrobiales bacterium]
MGSGARAVGLITLLCSVVVMTPLRSVPVAAGSPGRPNVVVVMTDDMSTAELEHLPHVQELLVRQGRTFDEYAVSVPVCCPSRVTMLRGQYAHNTGV